MRLFVSRPARADLDAIFDWIAFDNRQAATATLRAIETVAYRLVTFPGLGRAGTLDNTREAVVPSLPYVIVYAVDEELERVTILAVLHGARDLPGAIAGRNAEAEE